MIKLLNFNMPITGVFDGKQGGQPWAAVKNIKAAGGELFSVPQKGKLGKLHHKLMVLDDEVVIAGSFNYTGPANNLNDENIIILGDLDSTSVTQRAAQQKIATYARQEIERIKNDHGKAM